MQLEMKTVYKATKGSDEMSEVGSLAGISQKMFIIGLAIAVLASGLLSTIARAQEFWFVEHIGWLFINHK